MRATTKTLNICWRIEWRHSLRTGTKRITGHHAALGWLCVESWRTGARFYRMGE